MTATYRTYNNRIDADMAAASLKRGGIAAFVEESITPFDTAYTGAFYNKEFYLKIANTDFEGAANILGQEAIIDRSMIHEDYYLFSFTDAQLLEVLCKPDEWNEFDNTLARQLLSERGVRINEELVRQKRAETMQKLAEPEKSQSFTLLLGYLFSVFGGFIGIILGYMIWTATKTLPDGRRVYSYSAKDRAQGKLIFYLGLIIFPLTFLFRLFMKAE